MHSKKTLYLCYFGLREPLVQTQVLPYLRELAKGGITVFLLTFEKDPGLNWTAGQVEEHKEMLGRDGISWEFLTYHKRPSVPATVFDVICGAWYSSKLVRREKIDVIHGRVHIPTAMGWIVKKVFRQKVKLLFDVRGFFPEEYVDAGIWKKDGAVYRAVKAVERALLRDSDAFVTLTEKGRDILFPGSRETGYDKMGRPVEVVPCCVDLSKFEAVDTKMRQNVRERLGAKGRRVIAYVGSFGGFYMEKETAAFLGEAKRVNPSTFALILTQTPKEMIEPLLRDEGYTEHDYFIQRVTPGEIPDYLSAADFAVSFIKPCYSKLSSSPTKNAEYLASGIPIIVNTGVGDTAEFTRDDNVGVVVDNFDAPTFNAAINAVEKMLEVEDLSERCRVSAEKRFDLETVGGTRYRRLYQKLLAQD